MRQDTSNPRQRLVASRSVGHLPGNGEAPRLLAPMNFGNQEWKGNPMSESEMNAVVSELVLIDYQALKAKMQFMQATHASDHITPTHTVNAANDADRPKSFYMKKALVNEQQGQIEGTVGWGGKKGLKANIVQ